MVDIAGDSSTTATISVGGSMVNGALEAIGDHDWFRIELAAGQAITITLSGTGADPLYDTFLSLRNSSGVELAWNDDASSSNLNSTLSFTATSAGTYYIDVSSYPWHDDGDIGTYSLTVTDYVAPPELPLFTYDEIAAQLTDGFWESEGSARMHFDAVPGSTVTVNLTALTAAGQTLAREALGLWTDVIGITFSEVGSGGQITFDDSDSGAYATSTFGGGTIYSSFVNVGADWLTDYGTGLNSYSLQTYIHEIGHALGLGHAGNYNGGADYPVDALYRNDAWNTSVMSYFSPDQNSYFADQGFTFNYVLTPMVGDIVAMADLYGMSTTTRTGNTTYGFNSTAGRDIFNAAVTADAAYTIFDSGGIDTLNYSGYSTNQRIDLRPTQFSNIGSGVGNVTIAPGTIIENAMGGSGNDTLIGTSGNNGLTGGAGNDVIDGGGGTDAAIYSNAASSVVVSLLLAGAQNTRGAGTDTLISIEQLVGSNFNDRLTGNAASDRLTGGLGNDILTGNAGNDLLEGGEGTDSLDGGAGNDRLNGGNGSDYVIYSAATGAVVVNLGLTTVQSTGGAGNDQLLNIERVYGSNYGDTLTGNSVANLLSGRWGDDTINGGAGNDTIRGDGGNDIVNGEAGNDFLTGGAGDDVITGGDGNDRLYGNAGNDSVSGGAGIDVLYYNDARSAVTVNLNLTAAQNTGGGGIETISGIEQVVGSGFDDILTGTAEANKLLGGGGNDTLRGGAGDDIVQGDAGNDIVVGGAGNDSIYGGAGQDIFRFDAVLNGSTNVDILRDFSASDDSFQLALSVFGGIGAAGTLASSAFHVGTSAADALDRIIYDQASGRIYYDADGSGAGAQVLFARVSAGLVLTNADFILA